MPSIEFVGVSTTRFVGLSCTVKSSSTKGVISMSAPMANMVSIETTLTLRLFESTTGCTCHLLLSQVRKSLNVQLGTRSL